MVHVYLCTTMCACTYHQSPCVGSGCPLPAGLTHGWWQVTDTRQVDRILRSIRIHVHLHQSSGQSFFSLQMVARLPRELLAEGPPLNVTEALLHLLRCCLVSGHPPLLPSLSAAVQVFSQYSNYPNHKVGSYSQVMYVLPSMNNAGLLIS